jgi:hypothetical protein
VPPLERDPDAARPVVAVDTSDPDDEAPLMPEVPVTDGFASAAARQLEHQLSPRPVPPSTRSTSADSAMDCAGEGVAARPPGSAAGGFAA